MRAAAHALVAIAAFAANGGRVARAAEGARRQGEEAAEAPRGLQERRCPAPTYRPSQVTAPSASPSCAACAELLAPPGRECQFDVSDCARVETGGSCKVRCRVPYEGNATIATCPSGNSNRAQQLLYTLPECQCPEPPAQQGYVKSVHGSSRRRLQHFEGGTGPTPGEWECAPGYAGEPYVDCVGVGQCTAEENNVDTWLGGCKPLVPCAAPIVDACRYDVSACTSVQPGKECEVRCRPPFIGGSIFASCPDSNTDPDQELLYYSLTCRLEECPDPEPWPAGYNKTPAGAWTCAKGYFGKALNRCVPGPTWSEDCGAVSLLEGCKEIVNCAAEELVGLDACMFDTSGCQNVEPGEECEVHCKAPFAGVSTTGNYCPEGNTNRRGLIWTKPECVLLECDDPSIIPAGYMRSATEWQCAQSYSGYANKVCEATEACEVVPRLTGCAQLMPCVAPSSDCRYYTYDCGSVQPGGTCQISCQAPFTGDSTIASCLSGNTDPNGLIVEEWPTCRTDTCADPWPWPLGYAKSIRGWQCATGFAGQVQKDCVWQEAKCSAEPVLSGCTMEEPCVPLTLTEEEDICMFNISDCSSVSAGLTCMVSCNSLYTGKPVPATCPVGNLDPAQQLEWTPPDCDCQDPYPVPPGYNKTEEGWRCDRGFAGEAKKVCRPGPNCQAEPDLTGCYVPVACEVAGFDGGFDDEGKVAGTVRFGPAVIDVMIHEEQVREYRVYFADRCSEPLGQAIAVVAKSGEEQACCRSTAYEATFDFVQPPSGAQGLVVVVSTLEGDAPAGRFIELAIVDTTAPRVAVSAAVRPVLGVLGVMVAALGLSGAVLEGQ